jgi:DNA invertase Pin-like site-specific DNA recombinase
MPKRVAIYHRPIPFIEGEPLNELRAYAGSQGLEPIEYIENKSKGQPILSNLLRDGKSGQFSIVLVHSLLTVGGSLKQVLGVMEKLRGYGINLISLKDGLDMASSSAETLHNSLISYTKESQSAKIRLGQELARARNVLIGRKPMDAEKVQSILQGRERKLSVRAISRITGIAKSSVFDVLSQHREAQAVSEQVAGMP